ncbi:MAG: hypothetical protein IPM75_13305 [Candidatus Competibacteraceae bacterium]|nr:hypothetical protein [Candidatus Competibacteraceae bacterium]
MVARLAGGGVDFAVHGGAGFVRAAGGHVVGAASTAAACSGAARCCPARGPGLASPAVMGNCCSWRVLALGYALAFAACQDCLFACSDSTNRVRGAALFGRRSGGPPASAVPPSAAFAERIGYEATFAAGAALAAASGLLAARFIRAAPAASILRRREPNRAGKAAAKLLGKPTLSDPDRVRRRAGQAGAGRFLFFSRRRCWPSAATACPKSAAP